MMKHTTAIISRRRGGLIDTFSSYEARESGPLELDAREDDVRELVFELLFLLVPRD